MGCDTSTVSRWESGTSGLKDDDLLQLLNIYGVHDTKERQALRELNEALHRPRWWVRPGKDDLTDWFCSYLALEPIASRIDTYESRLIPGLLQTRSYAEAVIRQQWGHDEEMIRRLVDIRMKRQRLFLHGGTLRLWAIVDEAAFRSGFSRDIMREQIERLLHATNSPETCIQVVRLDAGADSDRRNSFSVLRLRNGALPEVVYQEDVESAWFRADPNDSDPYRASLARIRIAATSPSETRGILEQELRRA